MGLVLAVPDHLRSALAAVAAPLLDVRDGPALLDTLECFLRANGSSSAVARAMFVHRNTVGYRLGRVQELTGRGVTTTADRVVWTLALLALGRVRLLDPL